jgi:NTP pyrophosphatase (non-canonical NTP hydrolase)
MPLQFSDLSNANRLRLPLFKTKNGRLAHSEPDGSDWSIAEWTNAVAGEVGEACNIAKKIVRGDYADDPELGLGLLLDELADVIIYCDIIIATQLKRNTGIVVANKFNEKSDDLGIDVHVHSL